MRAFDSPVHSSHIHHQAKLKNHESPISKLTNLTDVKQSYQSSIRNDNPLYDRSNQVFVPKNASKYVEEPSERKNYREKEIDQIRKKYYENSSSKIASRPLSQKYDRYEVNRDIEARSNRKDQNGKDFNENTKRSVLATNRHDEPPISNRYAESLSSNNSYVSQIKANPSSNEPYLSSAYGQKVAQKQGRSNFEMTFQPNQLNPATNLDRISQASNSNYETVTKTLETLSPERNRIKSSFVVQDRSTKRKLNDANGYYFVDSFKNKENQSTVVKETTSVYNESATRVSHVHSHYERDSAKSGKLDARGRNDPGYLKPFTLDENPNKLSSKDSQLRPPSNQTSNSYPTIYDNYLPKSLTPATQEKPARKQDEIVSSRPRTYTEDKKHSVDRIQEKGDISRAHQAQDHFKRRVLKFEDDDKIKQIEKRLKDRQAEFKKRQQQLRSKCENTQYDRRPQYSVTKQPIANQRNPETHQKANQLLQSTKHPHQPQISSHPRPNVEKQIERLSMKIKQFQDRKKELNIPAKNIEHPAAKRKALQAEAPVVRQFEDARKALEEFRHGGKAKSTSEVLQVSEYQIPSSVNNEESNCAFQYEEQIGFHKKYLHTKRQHEENNKRCDFIEKTKPMYSEITLPTPKRMQASSFGFQLYKIESEGDDLSSHTSKVTVNSTSSNKTNSKQCKSQFQIHRRTDDGMEQRKKKLQENQKTVPSQELKRLVSLLSQQTIHDEEFRNCKIWFQNDRNENKWKELKRQLRESKQVSNQFTELKDGTIAEFHICEDENNPFFSVNQQSKFSYQTLVKTYSFAKRFWEENIVRKFSRNQLKSEGFNLEKFDLEKKGHINMEDLVRFLNFESGNFYRNRDLVLIFKRFTNEASDQKSEKALDIEKILKVIAS